MCTAGIEESWRTSAAIGEMMSVSSQFRNEYDESQRRPNDSRVAQQREKMVGVVTGCVELTKSVYVANNNLERTGQSGIEFRSVGDSGVIRRD